MRLFFPLRTGRAEENGIWYKENRSVTLSPSAVASYFLLPISTPSVLFSFQLFLWSQCLPLTLTLPSRPSPRLPLLYFAPPSLANVVAISRFHSLHSILLFSFSLSFICFLSPSLSLALRLSQHGGGGVWLSLSEMNFWLLLGRTEQSYWSEKAREERQMLEKIKKIVFLLAENDYNCTPSF